MADEEKQWTQLRIEQLISDGTEESLTLDYKDARSLARSDGKKMDISKDVSAMANSAGGIIIYGVAEYQDKARKHLPQKIDPVDRTLFSKEWLEQIISSSIQPRIAGVTIHPVPIATATDHVVYVVEIPQGHVAHQAKDYRYYKRFNFESVPMEDYERRDIDGRQQFPRIELEFEIRVTTVELLQPDRLTFGMGRRSYDPPRFANRFKLHPWAHNVGKVFAQYVNAFIEIPDVILPVKSDIELRISGPRKTFDKDGVPYYRRYDDNTVRDVIGSQHGYPNLGPARYVPILPGRHQGWGKIDLNDDFGNLSLDELFIEWEIYADNSPVRRSRIAVSDIEIVDERPEIE